MHEKDKPQLNGENYKKSLSVSATTKRLVNKAVMCTHGRKEIEE